MASNSTYQRAGGAISGASTGAMIGSAFGPIGTVAGGAIGGIAGALFGKGKSRPNMVAPKFIDVETVDVKKQTGIDLGQVSKENIQANLENLPLAQQLVAQADAFAQEQYLGLTEKAMPGFGAYQKKLTQAGMERLDSMYELPEDQKQYLARQAAERGVSRGTRGQFNEFDLMRDFGISSMQYGSQRLQEAQSIFQQLNATMPRVNPTSPLNFLTSGQQAQQQAQFDASYEFSATQFDFNQKLAQREARQAQEDVKANIANMNAMGQYAAAERAGSSFWNTLAAGAGGLGQIAGAMKGMTGSQTGTIKSYQDPKMKFDEMGGLING